MWNVMAGKVVEGAGKTVSAKAPMIGTIAQARRTKDYRKDLKKREQQMYSGELGYTEAQRRQMMGESMRAAQAANAPMYDQLRRQASATGPGAMQAIQNYSQMNQANAAAQQMAGINAESQRLAESRARDIRNEVLGQAQRVNQGWTTAVKSQGDSMQAAGEALQMGMGDMGGGIDNVHSNVAGGTMNKGKV